MLLHVVAGLVIVDGFPMLVHGAAVNLRIHRFVARIDVHRGHALADERVLVAAHEINFFRSGIGADLQIHLAGNALHIFADG